MGSKTRSLFYAAIRNNWKRIIGITAVTLFVASIGVVTPLITRFIIDEAIPAKGGREIGFSLACLVALPILANILQSLMQYQKSMLGDNVAKEIRRSAFSSVLNGTWAETEKLNSNDVSRRVTHLVGELGYVYLANQLIPALTNTILLLIYLAAMVSLSWQLTAIVSIAFPIFYFISNRLGAKSKGIDKKYLQTLEAGGSYLQEVFSNLLIVRTSTEAKRESQSWDDWLDEHSRAKSDTSFFHEMTVSVPNTLISSTTYGMVLGLGALIVIQGTMSIGTILAFAAYATSSMATANLLMRALVSKRSVDASFELLDEILAISPEPSGELSSAHLPPDIQFQHVSFSYGGQKQHVTLEDISFRVPAGSRAAIMGTTGAGKSTITKLLLGLYSPDSGKILIDGIDLRNFNLEDFRSKIGYVGQERVLWNRTLRQNLTYGTTSEVMDDNIWDLIRQFGLTSLIERLPDGLDSSLIERGADVSGGEAQRILLIRALLRGPRLLILDEPTSSLDEKTERNIIQTLLRLSSDFTLVVVTHRPGVASMCDQVIQIEAGRNVRTSRP